MGWASQHGPHRRPSYFSQVSCVIVSGCTAALDLDTHPLSNLIRPPYALRAKPVRGKPVLIMNIGFSRLVPLISRLVACGARIVGDKQTHRTTTTITLAAHARRGLIMHISFFPRFYAISLVSAKLSHIFSYPCSTEAVVIARRLSRSLYIVRE